MSLDELGAEAARSVREAARRLRPPEIEALRTRDARRRRAAVAGATLAIATVAAGVSLWSVISDGPPPAADSPVVPSPSATDDVTSQPALPASTLETSLEPWSIRYPPHWYRANRGLMPYLGWESLTLSTSPIRAGGDNCAHVPENALRDLGPGDALISVFFVGRPFEGFTPWPGVLDDASFPVAESTDAHECAHRPELEVHWDGFDLEGRGVYVLVAFGTDVAEETRAETWEVIGSLRAWALPDTDIRGRCVVTAAWLPALVPPPGYPAESPIGAGAGEVWYGTADLWTTLDPDGEVWKGLPRTGETRGEKTFWWSRSFLLADEPAPAIGVTARRIAPDGENNVIVEAGNPGSHGSNPFTGDFMLVGLELPNPGCWEITATYRGAVLSYVVLVT